MTRQGYREYLRRKTPCAAIVTPQRRRCARRQIVYNDYTSEKFGSLPTKTQKERRRISGNAQKLIKYMNGCFIYQYIACSISV